MTDLKTLGQAVQRIRLASELTLLDAADCIGISQRALARIEAGRSVGTVHLFKVLKEFGLAMLIMSKTDAEDALQAIGHTVNWLEITAKQSATRTTGTKPVPIPERTTPTLFVDYDGTLHAGHAYIDDEAQLTLDSGRPLFEFAPILTEILQPYPTVEIVLTTSWLQRLPTERVIAYLPPDLARRVVDTTRDMKPRFSYLQSGSGRTDVIASYAQGKGLRNWMALDDSVFDAHIFGRELISNFVLLDSALGISDEKALERLRRWLTGIDDRRTGAGQ
ncbi:HAD domain-containing protein [Paraburkholderia caballeronis]|uniref:HAD domain-containing protein n=1 Tax=Paraburkholderia caballeronis TaxID=416943 RepID=UPI001FCBA207|nr:HAD domain-containing protein [Paraburkholderia caballeronis]